MRVSGLYLGHCEILKKRGVYETLWLTSLESKSVRFCASCFDTKPSCTSEDFDMFPRLVAWDVPLNPYHGSIGSRLPLLKTPIPASYIAVENAVGVVRERCYRDDQTPVLKSEQFRY